MEKVLGKTGIDATTARHKAGVEQLVSNALRGVFDDDRIYEILASPEGSSFIDSTAKLYSSLTPQERTSAVFDGFNLNFNANSDEHAIYDTFSDIIWNGEYDEEGGTFWCSASFSLEGYDEYDFDVSIVKPELSGVYFVTDLKACGNDIYHMVYSEDEEEFVPDPVFISSTDFHEVAAQVQIEVEKTTLGKYDETVLDDHWNKLAEEQYESLKEEYGLV